jgi:hypothetical protein
MPTARGLIALLVNRAHSWMPVAGCRLANHAVTKTKYQSLSESADHVADTSTLTLKTSFSGYLNKRQNILKKTYKASTHF